MVLAQWRLAAVLPPDGKMKFVSGGSFAVMESIHVSIDDVRLASKAPTFLECVSRADENGVAT